MHHNQCLEHPARGLVCILRTATCKSVSGRSTLSYQLGCTADNTTHIRISKNTGAGQFSAEWLKIDDILKALAKSRKDSPLTSYLLEPLFRGKSVNTPAFIMAALTNERLLRVLKGKKRGHEFLDPGGFKTKMDKLAASGKLSDATRKNAVRKTSMKKAQNKKKAVTRKKAIKTR